MSTEMEYKFEENAYDTGRYADENGIIHYCVDGIEVPREEFIAKCGFNCFLHGYTYCGCGKRIPFCGPLQCDKCGRKK